ncbi:MAG: hypothetical protein CL915_14350 [Deltaproteobacteria bacterium]|nr:hypothetical protein [Deltaproteobacteria bacterium]
MNSHFSAENLDSLVQLKRINPKFIPKSVISRNRRFLGGRGSKKAGRIWQNCRKEVNETLRIPS